MLSGRTSESTLGPIVEAVVRAASIESGAGCDGIR